MAFELNLTPQPVRVTTPAGLVWQPLRTVPEVLEFDIIDIEFAALSWEGPVANQSALIGVLTNMHKEGDVDWNAIVPYNATLTPANAFQKITMTGNFFRFIRWYFPGPGWWGTQTAMTFTVRGMA